MDHQLSSARQKAVLSIAREQALVRQEAEKQLTELQEAMNELLSLYLSAAKLEGEGWALAQDASGQVVLRQEEKKEETSDKKGEKVS